MGFTHGNQLSMIAHQEQMGGREPAREVPMATEAIAAGQAEFRPLATPSVPRRARLLYSLSSLGGEALSRNRDVWFLYYYSPPEDSGLPELLPLGVISVLLAVLSRARGARRRDHRLVERPDQLALGPAAAVHPLWNAVGCSLRVPRGCPAAEREHGRDRPLSVRDAGDVRHLRHDLGWSVRGALSRVGADQQERVGLVAMKLYFGHCRRRDRARASGILVDVIGLRSTLASVVVFAFGCRVIGMVGVWNHVDRRQPPALVPLRSR